MAASCCPHTAHCRPPRRRANASCQLRWRSYEWRGACSALSWAILGPRLAVHQRAPSVPTNCACATRMDPLSYALLAVRLSGTPHLVHETSPEWCYLAPTPQTYGKPRPGTRALAFSLLMQGSCAVVLSGQ